MSFILDALKKSEGERQRQTGPTIFEVKIAPPKNRLPVWAFLIGALLAVNLGVVAWLFLRNSENPDDSQPAASATSTPQPTTSPMGQPASVASSQYPPPAQAPFTAPPVTRRNPLPNVPSMEAEAEDPVLEEDAADPELALNPEDYEPALEAAPPRPRTPPPQPSGVVRGTVSGLPTYNDAKASRAGIPELRLDLHVYSPAPAKRFVFLNMQKLQEGQQLSEGVRVDAITPTGVELSFQGTRFVLMRD